MEDENIDSTAASDNPAAIPPAATPTPLAPSTGRPAAPGKLVGALTSGLRILRYLGSVNTRVGVSRVTRDLGLNSSTCFNLLRTLVHEGMVSFDAANKTYALDLGLVELGKGALEQASYARMVRTDLEAIVIRHRVTATLWQRSGPDRVVLIDTVASDAAIRVHMHIGQRLPMYIAALGRCMAAHSGLSHVELKKMFLTLRWEQPPSFDQYLKQVDEARANGYAIDAGAFVRGVTTVSAAVLDAYDKPIMAISAVCLSEQFSDEQLRALAFDLRDRTAAITRALSGGSPGKRAERADPP